MSRGATLLLIYSIAALAAATWSAPLDRDLAFSFDDEELIRENPVANGTLPAHEAFFRDYWHHREDAGVYRPTATLLFRADAARTETPDPRVFRVTNIALHVAIVLGLGAALARCAARTGAAFPWFGLGVFAVHPALADVVAWISGRTSLASGFGAAAGLVLVSFAGQRRGDWIALLAGASGTLVASLGKEDGLVLAAVLPLFAYWAFGPRRCVSCSIGAWLAILFYGALRHTALGSAFEGPSAPIVTRDSLLNRVTLGLSAWGHGLLQLSMPWRAFPPALAPEEAARTAVWIAPAAFACAVVLAGRRARYDADARAALVGTLAAGLAALPLLQIVPAAELFAPRFLYQPLLLAPFAVAWFGALAFGITGRARVPLQVAALLALAWVSATSASERYASRLSYWRSFPPPSSESARVLNALGEAEREAGDLGAARTHFEEAARRAPGFGAPHANLGAMAFRAGDLVTAERSLRVAIERDPDAVVARANLANLLMRTRRFEEAIAMYRRAVQLAPGRAVLRRGLARAEARARSSR